MGLRFTCKATSAAKKESDCPDISTDIRRTSRLCCLDNDGTGYSRLISPNCQSQLINFTYGARILLSQAVAGVFSQAKLINGGKCVISQWK